MLSFLPAPLLGTVMMLFLSINTVFWASLVYVAILLKLIAPRSTPFYEWFSRLAAWLAQLWAAVNVWLVDTCFQIRWTLRIDADFNRQGQYLMCSNHQSWNDIVVAMKVFGRRAPFFKFFLKQELMWVPVLNLAWWGLDFPFMKRYTPEQVRKNPALKGKDLETTKKACERFKNQPALIVNYLEGTRFTPEKHARMSSPYKHLLKPKSGGFAFALSAMGKKLNSLLDVTILYPEGPKGFWEFMSGKVHHVVVEVRQLTIPDELYEGDYQEDPEFRKKFQQWIAELWQHKDQRLEALKAEFKSP